VSKARAEVAACADCTESQIIAIFGRTDPKTPGHDIAQAIREKPGMTGMEGHRIRSEPVPDDLTPLPDGNSGRNLRREKSSNFGSHLGKKTP
jgi:hypothetical protein